MCKNPYLAIHFTPVLSRIFLSFSLLSQNAVIHEFEKKPKEDAVEDGENWNGLKSVQCSQFVFKLSYFKSLTTVKLMYSDQMIILENIKTKYELFC